jgi:hypothetical protein
LKPTLSNSVWFETAEGCEYQNVAILSANRHGYFLKHGAANLVMENNHSGCQRTKQNEHNQRCDVFWMIVLQIRIPSKTQRKDQPPDHCNLSVEGTFETGVIDISPNHITQNTASSTCQCSQYRTPHPKRLYVGVNSNDHANDREGRKSNSIKKSDRRVLA